MTISALRFEEGEREKIDAIVDGFREHLKQDEEWEAAAGFPFAQHYRWARKLLRRRSGRRHCSDAEIASLLLNWARHCGDVRLYAVQPFAHWGRQCIEQGHQPHQTLQHAIRIVEGAKVSFIEHALDQLYPGKIILDASAEAEHVR